MTLDPITAIKSLDAYERRLKAQGKLQALKDLREAWPLNNDLHVISLIIVGLTAEATVEASEDL